SWLSRSGRSGRRDSRKAGACGQHARPVAHHHDPMKGDTAMSTPSIPAQQPGLKAIGYVRVSTDDQAREGVSLDVQEARIRAYCEAKGWQLVAVVREEGKSAKDLKRPGLQEILRALPKRQRCFDVVVVVKLDRLTRSVRDLGNLTDAFKRAR